MSPDKRLTRFSTEASRDAVFNTLHTMNKTQSPTKILGYEEVITTPEQEIVFKREFFQKWLLTQLTCL